MRTNTSLAVATLMAALTWTGCELGADPEEVVREIESKLIVTEINDFECFRAEVRAVEQPPQFIPQDAGATSTVVNGEAAIPIVVNAGQFTITKILLTIPENCGSVNGEIEYRGDPESNVSRPFPLTFNSGDTETFPRHTFK